MRQRSVSLPAALANIVKFKVTHAPAQLHALRSMIALVGLGAQHVTKQWHSRGVQSVSPTRSAVYGAPLSAALFCAVTAYRLKYHAHHRSSAESVPHCRGRPPSAPH